MINKRKSVDLAVDCRMIEMSGIGRYIRSLIPALISGFDYIAILGYEDELKEYETFKNVRIISLKSKIYSPFEQFELFTKIPRCNVFLSPHYNVPLFLPQAQKKAVIIPDVNHLVFASELSLAKKIYAKIFYKHATTFDCVFTISDFSKSEIVRYTACNPAKIHVAKCAIDTIHFKKLIDMASNNFLLDEVLRKKRYILYVGNIKPHKNLKRSLLAFEKNLLIDPNLKFIIVGKADNFLTKDSEVFEIVKANSFLKNNVEFTGKINDADLVSYYQNAELLLFPSLYEGFGLPPLESMFIGCPVISSREGSLPEICGQGALYCDAYNIDDIADKIKRLLSDSLLRDKLIDLGNKNVLKYSWSNFNGIILNKLKELSLKN